MYVQNKNRFMYYIILYPYLFLFLHVAEVPKSATTTFCRHTDNMQSAVNI